MASYAYRKLAELCYKIAYARFQFCKYAMKELGFRFIATVIDVLNS